MPHTTQQTMLHIFFAQIANVKVAYACCAMQKRQGKPRCRASDGRSCIAETWGALPGEGAARRSRLARCERNVTCCPSCRKRGVLYRTGGLQRNGHLISMPDGRVAGASYGRIRWLADKAGVLRGIKTVSVLKHGPKNVGNATPEWASLPLQMRTATAPADGRSAHWRAGCRRQEHGRREGR